MNKLIITILFFAFCTSTYSQVKSRETKDYVTNEYLYKLLSENDSLKLIFNTVKDKLTRNQIDSIFSKTKSGEYSIKKTELALQLTSVFGESWNFSDDVKSGNSIKANTFDELVEFDNSIPKSQSATFFEDGSLKRQETIYKNGDKEIIERGSNGRYLKKSIDSKGKESIEEIVDFSKFKKLSTEVKVITN